MRGILFENYKQNFQESMVELVANFFRIIVGIENFEIAKSFADI